jgi:hypothetical protein
VWNRGDVTNSIDETLLGLVLDMWFSTTTRAGRGCTVHGGSGIKVWTYVTHVMSLSMTQLTWYFAAAFSATMNE